MVRDQANMLDGRGNLFLKLKDSRVLSIRVYACRFLLYMALLAAERMRLKAPSLNLIWSGRLPADKVDSTNKGSL